MMSGVPAAADKSRRPATLGRYELLAEIGDDGGARHLARLVGAAGFEKLVVVRVLAGGAALDEARRAAQIKHANVADVLELGEADGRYFLAIEELAGEPLRRVAQRGREPRLDELALARVIGNAAEGLDAAHELRAATGEAAGFAHGHLTADSIVVLYTGQVKIADLGAGAEHALPTTAPERVAGGRADRRGDYWSLGVVMWEALTGERLFDAAGDAALRRAIQTRDIPRASEVNANIPAAFDDILARLLDRDPDKRYATGTELANDLEDVLGQAGYSRRNDKIAAYMAEAFADRIAARRVVMQQLAAGKPPGPAAVEAAFGAPPAPAPAAAPAMAATAAAPTPAPVSTPATRTSSTSTLVHAAPPPAAAAPALLADLPAVTDQVPAIAAPVAAVTEEVPSLATAPVAEPAAPAPSLLADLAPVATAAPEPEAVTAEPEPAPVSEPEPAAEPVPVAAAVAATEPSPHPAAVIALGPIPGGTTGGRRDHTGEHDVLSKWAWSSDTGGDDEVPDYEPPPRKSRAVLYMLAAGAVAAGAVAVIMFGFGSDPPKKKPPAAAVVEEGTGPEPTPTPEPEPAPAPDPAVDPAAGSAEPALAAADAAPVVEAAADAASAVVAVAPEPEPVAEPEPEPVKPKPKQKPPKQTKKKPPKTVAKATPAGPIDPYAEPPLDKAALIAEAERQYRTGLQLFARGENAAAIVALRGSIKDNPGAAGTWRALGLVYEKTGQKDQARAAFKRYLKIAPRAGDAAQIRARLDRLGT
jgi:serine/threonine-protein kinase